MNVLKKYTWLVGTLMRAGDKGLTLEQIGDRWDADDEMHDTGAFARRTFHRHRSEIADLFGIEIECYSDGSDYRYRIADTGNSEYFRRWLLDSIAVNSIVTDSHEAAQYISVEPTDNTVLRVLLEALKEQRMVSFDYQPYWKESSTHYFNFQPHALKMFERRWYLIGRYHKTHRTFALDRMSSVAMQEETFKRDPSFNMEKMFAGTYGIIVDEETPMESIRLKVDAYQANYLRSLPLHPSQHELRRNDEYSIFALRVRPTLDFKQKLLSLGSTVEVLQPESLRDEIKNEIKSMLSRYNKQ